MSLPAVSRRQLEAFLRPLYAGLDGVQTFGRVERLERRARELAAGEDYDEDLLELLTLFHGAVERLGSLGPDSRFELLLRGVAVPAERIERLRNGLGRFQDNPQTVEERLLHDACLLETSGVQALLGRLLEAGRRRRPLERVLRQLDPGPAPERFVTPAGAALAAKRRAAAGELLAAMREGCRREEAGPGPAGGGIS